MSRSWPRPNVPERQRPVSKRAQIANSSPDLAIASKPTLAPDRAWPEIYFDPRSLHRPAVSNLGGDTKQRAVLHAKCVVIDGRTAFVSSANFTEAAQERTIEVGVLVRSPIVVERRMTLKLRSVEPSSRKMIS